MLILLTRLVAWHQPCSLLLHTALFWRAPATTLKYLSGELVHMSGWGRQSRKKCREIGLFKWCRPFSLPRATADFESRGVQIIFFLSGIEIPPWTSNNSLAWIVDFTYEEDLWNCVRSCLKPSGVFLPSLWSSLQWMLVKPIISWKWLVDCKEKKVLSHLPKWNS